MMLNTVQLAIFAILVVAVSALPKNECNKGPSFWCENEANSIKCGVVSFCRAMSSRNDKKIRFNPHLLTKNILDAPPVNVSFYYESLCPGCRGVWASQVTPTFHALAESGIVNFEFVPYGNAQEQPYGSSWYFTCQHGPNECYGNLVETCAIHHYPDPKQHIPFLSCLEQYGPSTYGSYCASVVKINYEPIQTCANGDEGKQLEHQMALKTEQLSPPHQYVPWLTLNGQHTNEIQNGLSSAMLETVCNAYTGTKPDGCTRKVDVCYK